MAWIFKNKKFLYATTVLIGTMVGVGVFGIPFAFSKTGFLIGLVLLILIAVLTLLVDLMYGEIVLRTESKHQLVGYTQIYLKPYWKYVVLFANTLSIYAGLLAYIIISGDFLSNIFSPFLYIAPSGYSLIFFTLAAALVFLGLKRISWIELGLMCLFGLVILLIFGVGISKVSFENLSYFNFSSWFLPYGILLFAFAGISAVPLQREILGNQEEKLKKAIFIAVGFVAILYLVFAFVTLGVSGESTTPDAIGGLYDVLGGRIVVLGSIFGALAVFTSFLMLGSALTEMFQYDFKIKKPLAWLLVIVPPLLFFAGGLRTFIDIMSLGGSVGMAPLFVALILTFIKSKHKGTRVPEYSLNIPAWILYLLMVILVAGVFFSLFIH